MTEDGTDVPDGLLYTNSDEWVKIEGNIATVGITDYAQHQLGDIVEIEIPAVGDTLTAGGAAGTIESVKAAADLHAPVSGTVTEVNPALTCDAPDLDAVKSDAYSAWLYRVEMSNPAEKDSMASPADYKAKIQG